MLYVIVGAVLGLVVFAVAHLSAPRLRVLWLRVLDRVHPRYGIGGRPSPRVMTASPAMAARMEKILQRRAEADPFAGMSDDEIRAELDKSPYVPKHPPTDAQVARALEIAAERGFYDSVTKKFRWADRDD